MRVGDWVPLVGVPHAAQGRVLSGPIYGDFATLLQVLGEVPDLGKDRVELGQGYTKYCEEVYA